MHAASGDGLSDSKYSDGIQAPLSTVALYDAIYEDDTYKVQAAAVTELDWSIGNVTAALDAVGVWDNTVLIFTTDVRILVCSSEAPGGSRNRLCRSLNGAAWLTLRRVIPSPIPPFR